MQPIMLLSTTFSTIGTLAGRNGSHSCVIKMFILQIPLIIVLNVIITNLRMSQHVLCPFLKCLRM